MALTDKLTAIGEAIREKEGSADLIPLADMPDRIRALSSGGSGGGDDPIVQGLIKRMSPQTGDSYVFTAPAGVTAVPMYMFYNATYMTDVVFQDPALVTYFDDYCFQSCRSLTLSQGLPPNLRVIGQKAFDGAGVLNNASNMPDVLEIPASVTDVKWTAFTNSGVKKIRFLGTPSSIDSKAFNYCDYLTDIYVPWAEGAVANAPWGSQNKNSTAAAPDAATIHYNTPADAVIE